MKLSRRSFIKGVLAICAAAALPQAVRALEPREEISEFGQFLRDVYEGRRKVPPGKFPLTGGARGGYMVPLEYGEDLYRVFCEVAVGNPETTYFHGRV